MVSDDEVRGAAFRRLLGTRAPVTTAELADRLAQPEDRTRACVYALHARGQIRLDDDGRVVGSAGLNVEPDRHQIDLDGRSFWTWCAYDILGIFAALGASGRARSPSPDGGAPIELSFHAGTPDPAPAVLFRPDDAFAACCSNVYEQWCPNSNLFRSRRAARAWARKHRVTGTVLTLAEASSRGAADWRDVVNGRP